MIKKISLLLILVSFAATIKSQTTITGFVKDSLSNPVPGASVYLSRTTIGSLTDNDGAFTFYIPQMGEFELTASCVGYKPSSIKITSDGRKQNYNFRLSLNMIGLSEVTVSAKDPDRLRNYLQFVKLFIGETDNSESCKITNPQDLHLYRDPEGNYLKAFSVKPLRIINKSLGYTILYDLDDFNFNYKTGTFRFSGTNYFQPLQGNARNNRKWQKNRLRAYYGSRMNMLRAISSDSLFQNDFRIFESHYDSALKELTIVKPLTAKEIKLSSVNGYYPIYYKEPLMITYTDRHAELEGGLTGFTERKYLSSMAFNDTIRVYPYGYFDNPYSVTWGGIMAEERVADMLPYDFLQGQGVVSNADSGNFDSKIQKYLAADQKANCSDQLFVQTDRNIYKTGDTIHFQAYVRDRYTGFFESGSNSLYMILFNEKHIMTDSSRFRIENSVAPGWMVIPTTAEPGKYHLISFTDKMQNFDPENAFQLDLSVKKRETESIQIALKFDKESYQPGDTLVATVGFTNRKGDILTSQKFQCALLSGMYMITSRESQTGKNGETVLDFIIPDTVTGRPLMRIVTKSPGSKEAIIKDFSFPFEDPWSELRFLPEGGTFINGLEQRIGFNSTNSRGQSLFIKGLLKNSKGQTLDTIRSGAYGPGVFTCTSEPGMYVELTGTSEVVKKWPLPTPETSGLSLSVRSADRRTFYIEVQAGHYTGEKIYIAGTMNSNLIFSHEINLNKKLRIAVDSKELAAGVVQVTLFNKDLKPVAERLFYVNPDKNLKFTITTDKASYNTEEETEVSVSAVDSDGIPVRGYFSIAAIDSLSGFNPEIFTPAISYSFNYHPYLASNLPAAALAKGLENLRSEDLDLLFLVYGWSRYNWNFNQNAKIQPADDYDVLKMKILYAGKNSKADRKLDLVSLEGPSVKHLVSDNNGEITIPLDSLPEITRSVTLLPNTENKNRVQGAMLSIPYNEKYFRSQKLFKFQPDIPSEVFKAAGVNNNFALGDSVIEIPEVIIKGTPRPEKVYHDIYEEKYQYTWVASLDYQLLWSSFTFDDAIRRLTSVEITPEGIYLHSKTSIFGAAIPALIILDGQPLYSGGYDVVRTISPSQMTSLTVLKNSRGFYQYGEAAKGGIIFVNTMADSKNLQKYRMEWKMQHTNDRMLLPINIFRPYKEFYSPTKTERDNDPVFHSYSTAYWNPEVYLDGENPSKIRFTNLIRPGKVKITINGYSTTDLIGSETKSYMVH